MVLTYKNKFNKKYDFDRDEAHSLKRHFQDYGVQVVRTRDHL